MVISPFFKIGDAVVVIVALIAVAFFTWESSLAPGNPGISQEPSHLATSSISTHLGATASQEKTIELKGQKISIEIVDSDEERSRGLGGRQSLDMNKGMLFLFPEDGFYGIWMKDMHFSIDIVWLGSDGRVVSVAQNIAPETYPHVFYPSSAARYVLELPAGWAEAYNVEVGDTARL